MIPYGRQQIDETDVLALRQVLHSDYLTQGPTVPAFEQAVAERVGARGGVAVNSATSALHIACAALDLGPGDVLWTSPITFVASANCALYCGAEVDFVDIDPATFNLCPDALEAKLGRASQAGRLPRVIVPVHMGGQPCDMRRIADIARRHGVKIIEDASHAIGAERDGRAVGSGGVSDITVFSFHPVKIITTAEGGMAVSDDAAVLERMARLRSHGVVRDRALMTRPDEGPWYYEQLELGWNYRMTDLQAALGLSQLARIDAFLARRQALAERYKERLAGLPLRWQAAPDAIRSAWHLFVVVLDDPAIRRRVFDTLRGAGIGANVHYIPVHLQPHYARMGFRPGDFPAAEAYYAGAITLPLHPGLTDAEQDHVIETLAGALA